MSSNSSAAGGGISVSSLLGVAFVILKLCGVINWPWLWVTAPFWIPLAICVGILLVLAVLKLFCKIVELIARRM